MLERYKISDMTLEEIDAAAKKLLSDEEYAYWKVFAYMIPSEKVIERYIDLMIKIGAIEVESKIIWTIAYDIVDGSDTPIKSGNYLAPEDLPNNIIEEIERILQAKES